MFDHVIICYPFNTAVVISTHSGELTTAKLNQAWASCVRMLSSSISCILFSSFLKNEPLNNYIALIYGIILKLL